LVNPYPLSDKPFYENKNFLFRTLVSPQVSNSFGSVGVSILQGDDWSINANFAIGADNREAKVLSNPKLFVLNNQEASIDIVEEIPYLQSKTTSASTGDTTGTTSFKQAGIKLRVKPQINRDGSVVLVVAPEQSYRTGEAVDSTPIINTTKSSTTLMLRSGETAAIGGLIRETETNTENKIPLLGDIPLLGYLFKRVQKSKNRTELTIFITAKIVN
jgi:type II secretory pathway component GspD/PulD (secretin)